MRTKNEHADDTEDGSRKHGPRKDAVLADNGYSYKLIDHKTQMNEHNDHGGDHNNHHNGDDHNEGGNVIKDSTSYLDDLQNAEKENAVSPHQVSSKLQNSPPPSTAASTSSQLSTAITAGKVF